MIHDDINIKRINVRQHLTFIIYGSITIINSLVLEEMVLKQVDLLLTANYILLQWQLMCVVVEHR